MASDRFTAVWKDGGVHILDTVDDHHVVAKVCLEQKDGDIGWRVIWERSNGLMNSRRLHPSPEVAIESIHLIRRMTLRAALAESESGLEGEKAREARAKATVN